MPRRARLALLILAAAAGLIALYDRTTAFLGVGSPTVAVTLESATPIRDAGAYVCWRSEEAERAAELLTAEEPPGPVPPEGGMRKRFEVTVRVTTDHSGLGFERSRNQQRYLVVFAVLADGRRVAKVVELPDARESREVTVRLD